MTEIRLQILKIPLFICAKVTTFLVKLIIASNKVWGTGESKLSDINFVEIEKVLKLFAKSANT